MFGRKSKSAGATPNKNQNGEPIKSPTGKSKKKDVSQQHGNTTSSLPRNIFSFRRNRSRSSSGTVPTSSGPVPGPYPSAGQTSHSQEIINQADPLTSSYTYGQGYPLEGFSSTSDQSKSKSPYQSPTHTLSGMQKGYLRDGSLDRSNHSRGFMMGEWGSLDRGSDRPHIGSGRGELSSNASQSLRDRQTSYSKERTMERDYPPQYNNDQDRPLDRDGPSSYNNSKDRAIDREYPHMGARSLERDHYFHSRSRSMERPDYTTQLSQSQDLRSFRDSLILELQAQIAELNKECAKIQQEFDTCRDKLSSSMNSIKTFWSPELKKERALRKEETAKCNLLTEQLKVCQADTKV